MRRRSLRFQTLAGTILIVALGQVLAIVAMTLLVVRPQIERTADMVAQNVSVMIETYDGLPPDARPVILARLKASPYLAVWQGAAPPDRSGPPPRYMERAFMRALADRLSTQAHLDWRTDSRRKLWVQVYLAGQPYWIGLKPKSVFAPTGLIATLMLIAVGLASLPAYWLSRQLLQPLTDLRSAADRLNLSAHPEPLREDGLDEIAGLSRSFNAMTGRLREIEANRALVLAGISHDLRTPLTKLRLGLEMAGIADPALRESTLRQVETIERILSRFLQFARGFDAEPAEAVRLADLFAALRADYADTGLQVVPPPPGMTVMARPIALHRALGNLIENALTYGRPPVRLSWRWEGEGQDASGLLLSVLDQGEGFGEGEAELYVKPFVCGDAARQPQGGAAPGTGLGLAMVDQIVRLHGARLVFCRRDGGFEAAIVLPQIYGS
ncbi:ATP-binding protein [Asticcacaulis sp. AC402]|uniref:ATP-binding protein n=1 Tax=Asticcacaulis sp. AC402 TaxID=1282361 RepID=UPI0003C3E019|nr:ATP-binding protein [Asticcacaulis sp. AC402]ESQ73986.1 hypothetical protein ABAC402_16605 [Asticcacaulis sp. AC402]